MDVVAEPWMALAQSERGMKMPGIENHQRVLVGRQIFIGSSLLRSGAGARQREGRAVSRIAGTMLTPRGAGAKKLT
jgi:hypothetical protein